MSGDAGAGGGGGGRGREWEVVFRAPNYALGGMLKEILEGEGMLVLVRSQSGLPQSAFGGPVELVVPKDQAEAARALVEAFVGATVREMPEEQR